MKLGALLALLVLSACSEDKTRAPAAAGCNDPSCATPPNGGKGGDSGTDATTDANDDAATDALTDATVTAVGIVRPLSKFTLDPSAIVAAVTTVTVRGPKVGGGVTPDVSPGLDGTFTLPDVLASVGGPTWLQVVSGGAVKAIDGVPLPASSTFAIPLFDELLPQNTWTSLGIAAAYPTSPATVVVHVYDSTGARKSGVSATPFGDGKGPFYDDGTDVTASPTKTGARGTILFLGLTPSSLFNLTLATATKTYTTIPVPLSAGAVSHLALQVE